jgi:phosphoglycolate phosphatase
MVRPIDGRLCSVSQAEIAVRPLLVLWDVDHTLIENNGVNKETYALAFQLLTGRRAEYPAQTEGRTDPEIMRNMLNRHGIEPGDDFAARLPEALESAMVSNAAVDMFCRGLVKH